MNKLRILEFYELFKSDLMIKVGPRANMTDLAKITGENTSNSNNGSYYIEGNNKNIAIVNPCGFIKTEDEYLKNTGIRPVIDLDYVDINKLKKVGEDGLPIVEYLKYPTSLVNNHTKDILDSLYMIKCLNKKDEYTLNYKSILLSDAYIKNNRFKIGEYDFKTYSSDNLLNYKEDNINNRSFIVNRNREAYINKYNSYSFDKNEYTRFIHNDKVYWLKVEPILWYVDTKTNALISKDILIRGIDIDSKNIKNSNILEYMNLYMYKDMKKENKKIKTYSL